MTIITKMGISDATFTSNVKSMAVWGPSKLRKLKLYEQENSKGKSIFADLSLENAMLQGNRRLEISKNF